MKALRLRFVADAHLMTTSASHRAGVALAILAFAGVGWQLVEWQAANAAKQESLERVLAMRKPLAPARTTRQPAALTTAERNAWRELVHQLNTPWPRVFDALESAATPQTSLVLVERDGTGVRVQVEGPGIEPLLQFASRLRENGVFSQVTLLRHEVADREPGQPWRLLVQAQLADAGAGR